MLRKQLRKPTFKASAPPIDKGIVLLKVIANSKQTGKLNLSSQQLSALPEALFVQETNRSNDISFESSDNNWWEVVELTKLIVADNLLQSIDSRISIFLALKVLDLHNNCIAELPEEFGALENLQLLNLNSNKLTAIPTSICRLPLIELHLKDNQISFVPDNIDDMGTLQVLNLSGNRICSLPTISDRSSNLEKITHLNISSNQLSDLSNFSFTRLTSIVDLSMAKNKISVFPSISLPSLQILDLKYNFIKTFSAKLDCLRLKDLSLGLNKIFQLGSDCFSTCPDLEVFDVRDNNLPTLPSEVLKMYNLKRLDISNNSISQLPPELSLLKHLVAIHWSGNPLRGLPTIGGTAKLLEYLSLKLEIDAEEIESDIETLPYKPNVDGGRIDWVSVNLKSLSVDELLKCCDKPTSLNLSQNQISALPADFDRLSCRLGSLNLSKNHLMSFPSISKFENLVNLNLANNEIAALPNHSFSLPRLEELNLNHNRLTGLPTHFFDNIPALTVLLVSANQLADVNVEGLEKLKALKTLDLSNNNIKMIPPALGKLDLAHLQLLGNCFRIPRPDVLQKGTSSILQYLRDRIAI